MLIVIIKRKELYIQDTGSTSRLTLCQHNHASYRYDKNDEKFGESEEVLHVVRQFDTQTIDGDDQNWEDTRNLRI